MLINLKKLVSVILVLSLVITSAPIIGKGPVAYAQTVNISDSTSHKVEGNILTFTSGGQEVKVELCTSRMARVQLSVDGTYRQSDETYYMVQKNDWANVAKTVSDEGTYIKIETDDMVIRVQKSPVRVQMYKKDNITLLSKDADDQGMYWDASTGVRGVKKVEGPGGGGIFGFGTAEKGHSEQLNKYDLDVTDFDMDHGQLIAPFYMSTVGYGIFLNTIDQNTKFFKRGGGFETKDYLDYYFMYGPDFKTILNQYAELTGRMELYGKWAHGFMLSKYGNDNATQAEFLDWLDHLRGVGKYDGQGSYPTDVYVFDYGWRGDKWSPHKWDPTRFPDLATMFAKANAMGFEVGLHNNKGTPEAKVNDSDPATLGGRFLNPTVREKWVKAHMDNVIKPGYGNWFWPDEFDMAEGSTHYNWMPTLSTKSVYEAWKDYTDQSRPMFITRGSYAGQHFATAWSGDIQNTTEEMGYQIGFGLESGLVGYWTTSHDLGGFMKRPNDNLYTRWVAEFGAWNGIMRTHGHDGREPWTFSKTAQDTLKKNLKIRYALYPYTYSLAWQGYSQGVPMMRPMFLEDGNQNNSKTWELNRQYYYGDWFLVAPVLSESDTMVKLWLPANTTWYNYYTGKRYEGGGSGRNVYVNAKLTDIPVFVKSGAIIPMGPDVNYADEKPLNPLTLDIYPKGDTSFRLYEDDGRSRKYITENAYSTTKFDSHQDEKNITFRINKRVTPNSSAFKPVERSYNLKFNHINTVRGVTVNGVPIQAVDSYENFKAVGEAYWLDSVSSVVYAKTADTGEQIDISLDSDGIVEPALGEEGSAGPVINPGDKFELEQATLKAVTIDTEWKGYTGTGYAKGFKNVGDNVQFTVDIQKAGNYNLILRGNSGKKNDPKYDSSPRQGAVYLNNSKVTDFALKVTPTWGDASKNGDWFDYIISDVKLDAGANTFKINVEGATNPGNYNIDYMRFDYAPKIVDAFGTIEAETAATRQGVDVAVCSDEGGKYMLNHIVNGDWVKFSDIDFGTGGVNGFEARLASGLQGGTLEVWIDSMADQRAVEMKFGSTGSWNTWNTIQAPSQSITGIHDVYLKFVNTESASSILDLNWIRFLKDYTAPAGVTDAEKVAADKAALEIGFVAGDSAAAVTQSLILPVTGAVYGSTITWESSNTAVISSSGKVTRPAYSDGDAKVTMTAAVYNNRESDTKEFELTVLKLAQPIHTVTFKDWDGSTLATQIVNDGEGVTAPRSPTREGYTFIGWDKTFDRVKGDLTVTAQYVNVSNTDLASMSLSSGSLTFSPATTSYNVSVANDVTSLTVTAGVADSNATLTINGGATASGQASSPIALNVGSNTITIVGSERHGPGKHYGSEGSNECCDTIGASHKRNDGTSYTPVCSRKREHFTWQCAHVDSC
ncbi:MULTISPECIES: TIM-barrel domain-containing protein [unclassified Paenibacillus]|uniref:TIM-barrel domain-containing protein n=1 Tax=unclassified Paenibacillus TaxID=185978 RepID=UPI0036280A1E